MDGIAAESIIIKVGHGIIAIPRNKHKKKTPGAYSDEIERAKEPEEQVSQ